MSVWLRDRCLRLMFEASRDYAIQNEGGPEIPAECLEGMLDALTLALSEAIRPHRWDMRDWITTPEACETGGPDSFYNGVLHAARVVRELLPPTIEAM